MAAARLIQRGVTGMICASDVLALGSIRAARRLGLDVPGDVSVVGFDDSALMTCTDPPLTTVRQPIEMMGQAAVDLLVNQIEGTGVQRRRASLRAGTGGPRLDRAGPGARRRRLTGGLSRTFMNAEGRATTARPSSCALGHIASSFFCT